MMEFEREDGVEMKDRGNIVEKPRGMEIFWRISDLTSEEADRYLRFGDVCK
jgi:hypothetical protein